MEIETDRLLLRPLAAEDLDELVALHARPEVARFMRALPRERAVEMIAAGEAEWRQRGHGPMAILDREGDRFLGRTGLKYWPQFEETEVGWVLHPDVWGHGYATEAAAACGDWGLRRLELPYLTSLIRPDNARSIAVAERLGMKPLREDYLRDIAVVVYCVRRETWMAGPGRCDG